MAVDINGDGLIALGGTSTTQGRLRLAEDTDNGTNYVELTAPASVASNRTVTFPDANIDFTTGLGAAQGGTGLTSAGTAGNVLTSNGSAWVSQAAASGYAGPGAQVFTSDGTFTIPSGITKLKATIVGGGGGSGRGNGAPSGGGGGGGTAIKYLTSLTPGNTISVTVGSGGTGRTGSNGNGTTGGTSSIASGTQSITTVSATGGAGSFGPTGGSPIGIGAAGGSASNGDANINGSGGHQVLYSSTDAAYVPGNGGNSTLGGGPVGSGTGNNYGGGGAGSAANTNGNNGGGGIVIIEY
jgi:hypothetical protein